MLMVFLDLEGVLVPEIWIEFSRRTGIPELSRTTRDEPDYDKLMRERIDILKRYKLGLRDIQAVIKCMEPLHGAREFLHQLRAHVQIAILSDTFYEFAMPLMSQLDWPTMFCHSIEADAGGCIVDYHLRMRDHKRAAVAAFHALNLKTMAIGDSYNDIGMLAEAGAGILFRPPARIIAEFPQFPVMVNYAQLRTTVFDASKII